jgi:hypothetical protein
VSSPTARTLAYLRRSNYVADVAERFIPHVNRKRDLLGFADVVAVRRGEPGVLAVQATTRGHVADRLRRCQARPELRTWLAAGNRFEVWGWQLHAGRWRVHRVAVCGADLRAVAVEVRPRRRGREQGRTLFDE